MNLEITGLLSSELVRTVGWTLVHFLWQGAMIAAVLALALRTAVNARTRHDLCLLAMAAMAISPVATFLAIRGAAPVLVAVPGAAEASEVLWQAPLVGLWAAGVLVLAVRAAGGIVLIEGLRRRASALPAQWAARCMALHARLPTALPILFRQSREAEGPLLVGWLRPMVLIPTAALLHMPADQLEALILHEIAHVRRFDAFANLIQTLVETALFYHPAVWWVGARLRIEREHCCDDLAVAASGDVRLYVRALVSMEACRAAPEPALGANGGSLRDRAARLLRLEQDAGRPLWPRLAALGVLAVGLAASIYGASVEAAPDPAAPPASGSLSAPRSGPVSAALDAETRIVAAPKIATPAAPIAFAKVPAPLTPVIRERAPWSDPTARATERLTTLERMIESNQAMLTSGKDLLAASQRALAAENSTLTEAERIDHRVNLEWLPGSIALSETLLAKRLENRAAVEAALMARRDLLAGRAFRADVARTEALWEALDSEVLSLSGERVDYLAKMQETRRAALGLPAEAQPAFQYGARVRAAAQRAREAEAVYSATKRELDAGGGPVDEFEAAVDTYRAAQETLRGSVAGGVETSLSVQRLIRRRAGDMQAKAEAAAPATNAAIETQPAAR